MKTKACMSAIFRLAVFLVVTSTPNPSLGLFIIASLWAIEPLWRRWLSAEQGEGKHPQKGPSTPNAPLPHSKGVCWLLAVALLVAPFNVQAQEAPPPRDDTEAVSLIEGILAVVIVAIVGHQYYRYCVKAKKQVDKIAKKKGKQVEDTNPWPADPEPATNTIASKVSGTPTEYGAWYLERLPAAGDLTEDDRPLPVIEWVTPERGESVKPRFYFPANPIELSDYLGQHGLSESTNANYSLNGSPTSNAPPIFSYTNLVLKFSIPGTVNRTSLLQRSPDLSRWETIFTAVAPSRMLNNFADGTRPVIGSQFYRVLVLP